ncbi:MAG: hypothetical protein AAGH15_19815 [Myxococcota bacterium]
MSVALAFCGADEEAELRAFLDAHWRRDHVFVRVPELLRFQHRDRHAGDRLNFVVARDAGRMVGALGFIPFQHYGEAEGPLDLCLAIWKVREGVPGLGLALLKFLRGRLRPRLIAAFGLSDVVLPIYRALGYHVGVADHHVLFHPGAPDEGIARRAGAPGVRGRDAAGWALRDLDLADQALGRELVGVPHKPAGYLRHRFAEHPWYRYGASGVFEGRALRALVVWRRNQANERSCLRAVDLWGDEAALARVPGGLARLLEREGADYVDLVHHGVDGAALAAAGFVDRRAHEGLVLPIYFEPFERRNVDLTFSVKAPKGVGPVRLFRGDSDQDRPNLLAATVARPARPSVDVAAASA